MKILKAITLILFAIICISCTSTSALAYTLQGTVTYVYDGDTINLREGFTYHHIRLASIDAPEKSQPYGLEATILLRRLVKNKTVLANVIDTDKYGRKIAYIKFENKDISSIMLANGAAWHYKAFDKTSAQYDLHYALEQEAKSNKRGLWAHPNPIAPWQWRKHIDNKLKHYYSQSPSAVQMLFVHSQSVFDNSPSFTFSV